MLEHDVGVLADELADLLAEPAPLRLVLGVLVGPEAVVLGRAVDDGLAAHVVEQLGPLGRRHDADRGAAAVQHVLHGVARRCRRWRPTPAPSRPASCGRRARRRACGSDVELHSALTAASSHVRWVGFGISWLAFTTDRSARPPKFVSKPQIRWLAASIESSCADGSWSSTWLQCTVTRSPGFQLRTAEPTRSTTPEASEPTTWYGWAWRARPLALAAEAVEEPERRQRLEDRRPHGVEVDRARHHGDVHLVGRELGGRHLVDVERLARVLLLGRHALEHRDLVAPHERCPVRLGDRQMGDLVARCTSTDRREDVFHDRMLLNGNSGPQRGHRSSGVRQRVTRQTPRA